MKNIDWELKNLDSLKEYIFDDLIGEHPNTSDINEAINTYAERYHEMKLKLLGIADVVGRSEQLVCPNCTGNNIETDNSDIPHWCKDCGAEWAN